MKLGNRTPFPNVAPLFVFMLCVAACCTVTTVETAEPVSNDYTYRWRQQEGKVHVLWIGGGHWHDTLQTAAILRRALEKTGRFYVTYTEDTNSLRKANVGPWRGLAIGAKAAYFISRWDMARKRRKTQPSNS